MCNEVWIDLWSNIKYWNKNHNANHLLIGIKHWWQKELCSNSILQQILFSCANSVSSIFLTTFGICFTFLLYITTCALILFSFENSLLENNSPEFSQVGKKIYAAWIYLIWICAGREATGGPESPALPNHGPQERANHCQALEHHRDPECAVQGELDPDGQHRDDQVPEWDDPGNQAGDVSNRSSMQL